MYILQKTDSKSTIDIFDIVTHPCRFSLLIQFKLHTVEKFQLCTTQKGGPRDGEWKLISSPVT